ncbi:MAG: methyl-accepting chemotaxis protein, partial [Actinomycetota bacterium]
DAHGRDLWLRGAYNPVIGSDGEVVKIVKGVANITDEVLARQEASRVGDQIATAVSEFSGAIQQISGTVSRTAALAGEAESGVSQASDHIGTLQATSDQIGSVIDIIKGLSGQTNTLALNATIEAARAGEAGRGFAVVANQVKELAGQTNLSADDIGRIIEAIQTEIKAAVVSVEAISTSVGEVSDMTATVAAAVEEQSALMGQLDAAAGELLRLSR